METRKLRTVLSLFDGMSCGQIALKELGVEFDTYYASEIDQNAINHTQLNFPDTIQLGDVTRWREWDIDWSSVDLILAGSPCQGFSTQGLNAQFDDPRSKLYWEFSAILKHIIKHNPNVKWLLENVKMSDKNLSIISNDLRCYPVIIDSARMSAQSRVRAYWSNIRTRFDSFLNLYITDIPQPIPNGMTISDILESEDREALGCGYEKVFDTTPFRIVNGRRIYKRNFVADGYVATLDSKAFCLQTSKWYTGVRFFDGKGVTHFSRRELMRLQTVPDWYKCATNDYQSIRNITGNGWTVKVIEYILSWL